jgi:hypothetical protein
MGLNVLYQDCANGAITYRFICRAFLSRGNRMDVIVFRMWRLGSIKNAKPDGLRILGT